MSFVLGIDPGLSGAIALLDIRTKEPHVIYDMPTHEIKGKRKIDLYKLVHLIEVNALHTKYAFIEDVGAGVFTGPGEKKRKQGAVSAFNFGNAHGIATGIVASFMIPIYFVKPAVWKLSMGLSRDKDASRQKASHLFPKHSNKWSRKCDDGRAEALLLAVFGSRYLK